jgi:hypothetical protein
MLYRLIIKLFMFFFCIHNIYSQNEPKRYAGLIDSVVFYDNNTIELSVPSHPSYNGIHSYEMFKKNCFEYINFLDETFLILRTDDFLILRGKTFEYIGLGMKGADDARSGRQMEMIGPAKSYWASSTLIEGGRKYIADNLSSVGLNSPWVEGAGGGGIGEYLDIEWWGEVSMLLVVNGFISYDKPELFEKNNRVKTVKIYSDTADKVCTCVLEDSPAPQIIKLGFSARKMRVEIVDVYPGSAWDDTCLDLIHGILDYLEGIFE